MFHRTYHPYRILLVAALALTAILCFSFWLPYPQQTKHAIPSIMIVEEAMKGVLASRYDKNGKLIQVMQMDSWMHQKGETTTQMFAPHLTVHQENGARLTVFAKQGTGYQTKVGTQIDQLKLRDNVIIKQINMKTDSEWELRTNSLQLFPKDPHPFATTDDKVTVYAPSLTIHAVGMHADLHRETIEFLHQVKTYYATSPA